ncbi:hypothetical protein [Aestuariibius sp. HNIBRBA575]
MLNSSPPAPQATTDHLSEKARALLAAHDRECMRETDRAAAETNNKS